MLDRDFLADGNLPHRPNGSTDSPQDSTSPDVAPTLAAIRAKAERIVALLSGIDGCDGQADHNLSLAEELAQDIAELCPADGLH